MKRNITIVLFLIISLVVMSAGPIVFNVRRDDSTGVSYVDTIYAYAIKGVSSVGSDSLTITYIDGELLIIDSFLIQDLNADTVTINEVFTVSSSAYTVDEDGKQSNLHLTVDSFLIQDASGADSMLVYDDGDTLRIVVDNPLKLTADLTFTDFIFGNSTFGTGNTADTVENTAIASGDYGFITWNNATDSVYEVGGGYHVIILEDTIIVNTVFEENGTKYSYFVK